MAKNLADILHDILTGKLKPVEPLKPFSEALQTLIDTYLAAGMSEWDIADECKAAYLAYIGNADNDE